MKYRTLNDEVLDLTSLSDAEKKVYEEAKRFVLQNPEWTSFTNFWTNKVRELKASVDSTIYKILQDMDSRMGIRQGLTRLSDEREGESVAPDGEE